MSEALNPNGESFDPSRFRRRLDVAVAFKDADRGRSLTEDEKLTNLRRWLAEEGE